MANLDVAVKVAKAPRSLQSLLSIMRSDDDEGGNRKSPIPSYSDSNYIQAGSNPGYQGDVAIDDVSVSFPDDHISKHSIDYDGGALDHNENYNDDDSTAVIALGSFSELVELDGMSMTVFDADVDIDAVFATSAAAAASSPLRQSTGTASFKTQMDSKVYSGNQNELIDRDEDVLPSVDLAASSVSVFYNSTSVQGIMQSGTSNTFQNDLSSNSNNSDSDSNVNVGMMLGRAALPSGSGKRKSLADMLGGGATSSISTSVGTGTGPGPGTTITQQTTNTNQDLEISRLKEKVSCLENDAVELLEEIQQLRDELLISRQRQEVEQNLKNEINNEKCNLEVSMCVMICYDMLCYVSSE